MSRSRLQQFVVDTFRKINRTIVDIFLKELYGNYDVHIYKLNNLLSGMYVSRYLFLVAHNQKLHANLIQRTAPYASYVLAIAHVHMCRLQIYILLYYTLSTRIYRKESGNAGGRLVLFSSLPKKSLLNNVRPIDREYRVCLNRV